MILISLLVSVSIAITCPTSRDNLIPCFQQLVDKNNDSMISIAEINSFLMSYTCINNHIYNYMNGARIMQICDLNKDGVLTLSDWTHPNACLMKNPEMTIVCNICKTCMS